MIGCKSLYIFIFLLLLITGFSNICFVSISKANDFAEKDDLFFGIAVPGIDFDKQQFHSWESQVGIPLQMINFFLQWPKDPEKGHFPYSTLRSIRAFGAIPCLTWEPMFYDQGKERMVSWRSIVEGKYDRYIRFFAQEARDWGYPFLLRFAHEMNLQRYHWGTRKEDYGPKSPQHYQEMFRYVVSKFRQEGADNAFFVFCPNAESVPNPNYDPSAGWNKAADYYPGDEYVQVLGMDGYNWGTTQTVEEDGWKSHWQSFEDIFRPLYHQLRR